jgi:hypothetical protein
MSPTLRRASALAGPPRSTLAVEGLPVLGFKQTSARPPNPSFVKKPPLFHGGSSEMVLVVDEGPRALKLPLVPTGDIGTRTCQT